LLIVKNAIGHSILFMRANRFLGAPLRFLEAVPSQKGFQRFIPL